jgi:hypothetical protein
MCEGQRQRGKGTQTKAPAALQKQGQQGGACLMLVMAMHKDQYEKKGINLMHMTRKENVRRM